MQNIEIAATVFGLISIIFTVRENIWCWPTGIVMVVLYTQIFYDQNLFSGMILQVIYIFLQIYGWHNWLHGGKDQGRLTVSRISPREAIAYAIICLISSAGLGYAMNNYTNADLAYFDASVMVLSLAAQYLMTKKILESWLIWISVDVISVWMYYYKKLYLTMGLYAVFLCIAAMGFFEWMKSSQNTQPDS